MTRPTIFSTDKLYRYLFSFGLRAACKLGVDADHHHLSLGHLKMLLQEMEPKFSPCCMVLGRCLQRVSGRKRAAIPPRQENVPMMTSGSILLIVP